MSGYGQITLDNVQFAEDWARITVEKLRAALGTYRIGRPGGNLWRSITTQVIKHNGNVDKVITRFLKYGRFVDMGTNKYTPLGARGTIPFALNRENNGQLRRYTPHPRPWYSKTYFREVQIFKELYVRHFDTTIPPMVTESLAGDIIWQG